MIHHRKSGLVAILAASATLAQMLLFLPFLFGETIGVFRGPLPQLTLALYFLGFFLAGAAAFILYEKNADRLPHFGLFESISLANRQAATLGLIFVFVAFATKDEQISRAFLLGLVGAAWIGMFLLNYHLPPLLGRRLFGGEHVLPTLLVGSEKTALRLKGWIEHNSGLGFRFEGLVTYQPHRETPSIWGVPVLGDVSQIHTIIEGKRISQVVILDTLGSKNWIDYLVETVMDKGCRVLIYNNWEEMFDRPLTLVREGEHTFFSFQEEPLENPIARFTKRGFDLLVSIPVCLVVLPPLYLFVAAFASFQSPGPILYKQTRCGRRGQFFTIFKFRSMHVAPPTETAESKQAVKGDARVYPLGRFLRRFSLDEMPQFVNVLRGEMSVVGPRPHLPQHDEMFAAETKYYRTRFFVKPGITGLAQVKGYRGEIIEPSLLHERVRWDLAYIRGWSLWLDCLIVLRTVRQMLLPPGSAY